jgi:hypothetical protein
MAHNAVKRCALKPLCAFSMHPLMTWWPSQLLRLPVFRKSISKVSRRQHTYSCVDVKPLTSLREFRITNAQRFSAEKFSAGSMAEALEDARVVKWEVVERMGERSWGEGLSMQETADRNESAARDPSTRFAARDDKWQALRWGAP